MSLKSPFSSLPLSPLWREIVLFFLPPVRVTTRARLRPRQPRPLQPRPRQPRPRKAARVCVPTAAAAAEGTPARLPCPRHPRDDKAQFGALHTVKHDGHARASGKHALEVLVEFVVIVSDKLFWCFSPQVMRIGALPSRARILKLLGLAAIKGLLGASLTSRSLTPCFFGV
jgi:hypothetical protein